MRADEYAEVIERLEEKRKFAVGAKESAEEKRDDKMLAYWTGESLAYKEVMRIVTAVDKELSS